MGMTVMGLLYETVGYIGSDIGMGPHGSDVEAAVFSGSGGESV